MRALEVDGRARVPLAHLARADDELFSNSCAAERIRECFKKIETEHRRRQSVRASFDRPSDGVVVGVVAVVIGVVIGVVVGVVVRAIVRHVPLALPC